MDTPEEIQIKKSTGKMLIQTPSNGSYLVYIRSMVTDLARQVGFEESDIAKIEMAVDEACSNVVEHAYAPNQQWRWQHRQPEIRMEIHTEHGRLVIEINDHGQQFDFANYRPVDLQQSIHHMEKGGYGIPIMRHFMDEVEYSSNDQTGNTLRLVKYLKKP